jgi:pentapeptide repeat protein
LNFMLTRTLSKFDAEAWKEALLALNPWARGLTISQDDEAFKAARQKATLDRHAQGREAWNGWADALLASKQALEKANRWIARSAGIGINDETRCWLALSAAVFSTDGYRHTFDADADFENFVFPGVVRFESGTFCGVAKFGRATFSGDALFGRATFARDALFGRAAFFGVARFGRATFSGVALFDRATFSGDALFLSATFSADARFDAATFSGEGRFETATFSGLALFGRTIFSGAARFASATFERGLYLRKVRFNSSVDLSQVTFRGSVDFDGGVFGQSASFEAIDSQGTFSLADATFHQVPSFFGARISTLRLDNVKTPRYQLLGWTLDKDAPARFRDLKRRANEAQDRDRELEFFAQEIRTSRFHAKGLPAFVPRAWEWRFWFGLFYGMFSNFGRSLWRPLLFWLALFIGFAVFYLGEHEEMRKARASLNLDGLVGRLAAYAKTTRMAWANPPACRPQGRELFATTDAVTEALQLSLRNAMVFEFIRVDAGRRTYGCLFGLEGAEVQEYPKVSPRVSLVSAIHSLASGILIFLFALAVRNLLRPK